MKSSAYLQAWEQRKASRINFVGLRTLLWKPESGNAPAPAYHSDLYIFCVHTAKDDREYDPLSLDQWQFWVVSRAGVATTGYKSLTLAGLRRLATRPVGYASLKDEVARVAAGARAVAEEL